MVQEERIYLPMPEAQETRAQSLGGEDPLHEEMATRSSILAWRLPWIEELGGYSPWSHKESDTTEGVCVLACAFPPTPSVMSQRVRSLTQSCLTLRHPVDHSLPGSSVHGTLSHSEQSSSLVLLVVTWTS